MTTSLLSILHSSTTTYYALEMTTTRSSQSAAAASQIEGPTASTVNSPVLHSSSPQSMSMDLSSESSSVQTGLISPLPATVNNKVRRLEVCIDITAEKVARYSEMIAGAPIGQDTTATERLLRQTSATLELHRKNLAALKDNKQDEVESTGLKKFSSVVPRELRPFQWEGHLQFSDKSNLFTDLDECLQNFQDVVLCHRLDLSANYVRLLPPLLSASVRS